MFCVCLRRSILFNDIGNTTHSPTIGKTTDQSILCAAVHVYIGVSSSFSIVWNCVLEFFHCTRRSHLDFSVGRDMFIGCPVLSFEESVFGHDG